MLALWALGRTGAPFQPAWVQPAGSTGKLKIVRFYASVGALNRGDKALLCYEVQNARSVRIAPAMMQKDPSASRCLEVGPRHTTRYTILAEGFDGSLATKSLIMTVTPGRQEEPPPIAIAAILPNRF